jgi:hypothetical protein
MCPSTHHYQNKNKNRGKKIKILEATRLSSADYN